MPGPSLRHFKQVGANQPLYVRMLWRLASQTTLRHHVAIANMGIAFGWAGFVGVVVSDIGHVSAIRQASLWLAIGGMVLAADFLYFYGRTRSRRLGLLGALICLSAAAFISTVCLGTPKWVGVPILAGVVVLIILSGRLGGPHAV